MLWNWCPALRYSIRIYLHNYNIFPSYLLYLHSVFRTAYFIKRQLLLDIVRYRTILGRRMARFIIKTLLSYAKTDLSRGGK